MSLAWRQELFYKSAKDHGVPFVNHRVAAFNLPNKARAELPCILERAQALHAALPDADVCVHYSIAYNYHRSADASWQVLEAFCRQLSGIERCSLLLVSGGGPRRRLDSLAALQLFGASQELRDLGLPLATAYNPYFPDAARREEERLRLRQKLVAGRGLVTAVYLQAGSDVDQLTQGLNYLEQLLAELEGCADSVDHDPPPPEKRQRRQEAAAATAAPGSGPGQGAPRVQVYGSVLLPSRKLLAQMRFRPWGGVFLSEQYLSSVEAAEGVTRQLLRVYARHRVVPLVETEVSSEAEMERLEQLLRSATAPATAGAAGPSGRGGSMTTP